MIRRFRITVLITATLGVIVGVLTLASPKLWSDSSVSGTQSNLSPQPAPMEVIYVELRYDEMVSRADVIFVGRVSSISKTQWNQDSGEIWYDGPNTQPGPDESSPLQLHYIDFDVVEPIIDTVGLGKTVRVMVLGTSPFDGEADHDLKMGDQVIVFTRSTELTWREGKKPIIQLMGPPVNSYLKQEVGGSYSGRLWSQATSLDEMIRQIKDIRNTPVQP